MNLEARPVYKVTEKTKASSAAHCGYRRMCRVQSWFSPAFWNNSRMYDGTWKDDQDWYWREKFRLPRREDAWKLETAIQHALLALP